MKLLNIIKNLCMTIGILIIGDTYSMKIETIADREKKLFDYIDTSDTFMREFPLMTLNLVQYRYNRCTPVVQENINEKLNKKENICNKVIFFTREAIINTLIVDEKWRNIFLNIPVKKLFESLTNHSWALQVYNNKEATYFIWSIEIKSNNLYRTIDDISKKVLFDKGYIVRYANEIKKVDAYMCAKYYKGINNAPVPIADRSTLVAFNLLNETIKEIHCNDTLEITTPDWITYNFRKRFTVKNILNGLKKQEYTRGSFLLYCILMVMTGASKFIEFNCCQKILTTDLTLMEPTKIIDPYYNLSQYCKINIPFVWLSLWILSNLLRYEGTITYGDYFVPLLTPCLFKLFSWILFDIISLDIIKTLIFPPALFLIITCYHIIRDIKTMHITDARFNEIFDVINNDQIIIF